MRRPHLERLVATRWLGAFLREVVQISLGQPLVAVIGLIVAAGSMVGMLLTAGETLSVEQRILGEIDAEAPRLIDITIETPLRGSDRTIVDRVAAISTVEAVIGLGSIEDVTLGLPGSTPVAGRSLLKQAPDSIGPQAAASEGALVGVIAQQTLGLERPAGTVLRSGEPLGVVGSFSAPDPFGTLDAYVLWEGEPAEAVRRVLLVATSVEVVATTADIAASVLGGNDGANLVVATSDELVQVRQAVSGALGRNARVMVAGVLGAALVFTAMTTFAAIQARRRDFGRRRALGASRGTIVGLVCTQQILVSGVGTLLGAVTGLLAARLLTGATPTLSTTVAMGTLVAATAVTAAVPPAVIAARRDPVRVLRVP